MFPACRTASAGFAMPIFDLTPPDVAGLLEDLWEFQSNFHDCFPRRETRAHFFDYMGGQLSPLERTSIEPMALHVQGGTLRGLQRFSSAVPWDEEPMRWTYHQLVADAMGDPEGVLRVEETGLVKKGKESVGVARQYCGTLGKVEHCQGGVCAGQASRHGYALVEQRLFLPEVWCTDAYAARRTRCNVPTALTFQSKPQLAAAMVQAIAPEGLLPCTYVVAACLYGQSPAFLEAVDACVGVTTCVAIPADTRGWLQRPRTEDRTYTQKGEVRVKRVAVASTPPPSSVAALAAGLPASSWYRRPVSEGTKGPLVSECARQRITLGKDGLPERTVWLVLKRSIGLEPTYTYDLSNAPGSTPRRTFVW